MIQEIFNSDEIFLMDAYMSEYGSHNHMPVVEYLQYWLDAKEDLLKMFNGQLIRRFPIEMSRSEGILMDELCTAYTKNEVSGIFYDLEFICNFMFYENGSYWNDNRDSLIVNKIEKAISSIVQCRTMALNSIDCGETIKLTNVYSHKTICVSPGQKPFRLYNQLLKMAEDSLPDSVLTQYNIDLKALKDNVEKARLIQSQVLNKGKMKGNLCLSIHPMDYMTMSDNDYNWSSCMSWREHGCYHAGTVEMMNSPYVVVAYLDGEEEWYPISGQMKWSNKKWRELFIVSRDFISGIKAYPYHHTELENIILDKLSEIASQYYNIAYEKDNTLIHENDVQYDGISFHFSTSLMYNDFDGNDAVIRFADDFDSQYAEHPVSYFNYSGTGYCMVCGDPLDFEEDVVCEDCADVCRCSHCGNRIDVECAFFANGEAFCEDCYERLFKECEHCGELTFEDDLVPINVFFKSTEKDRDFYFKEIIYCCQHCFDKAKEQGLITTYEKKSSWSIRSIIRYEIAPDATNEDIIKMICSEYNELTDNDHYTRIQYEEYNKRE